MATAPTPNSAGKLAVYASVPKPETQQFEADMNHDELMDRLNEGRIYAPAPREPFEICVDEEKYRGKRISQAAGHCMVVFMQYHSWSVTEALDACTKLPLRRGPLPVATMRSACQASLRWAQKL